MSAAPVADETIPGKARSQPRNQSLEDDLAELKVLCPWTTEELPIMFKKAVKDCLANIVGEAEATALVLMVGDTNFGDPNEVFAALGSFFPYGSDIVSGAIFEEFQANIHLQLEEALANQCPGPEIPMQEVEHVSLSTRVRGALNQS
jgi:hypothetical protein